MIFTNDAGRRGVPGGRASGTINDNSTIWASEVELCCRVLVNENRLVLGACLSSRRNRSYMLGSSVESTLGAKVMAVGLMMPNGARSNVDTIFPSCVSSYNFF